MRNRSSNDEEDDNYSEGYAREVDDKISRKLDSGVKSAPKYTGAVKDKAPEPYGKRRNIWADLYRSGSDKGE